MFLFFTIEVLRTVEELEKQGKQRAAESLRGQCNVASACCELAPGKLMGHSLEVLRSSLRGAAPAGGDIPIEIWLRLWHLHSLRLVSLKSWNELKMYMQLQKWLSASQRKELDLIRSPFFAEIVSRLPHQESKVLAARYYVEVFFSDECLLLVKADDSSDIVKMCLTFYTTWAAVEDKVAAVQNIPDEVIASHDEVVLYATAMVAVAHPEPIPEGPVAAMKVFSDKNRLKLSEEGKQWVNTVCGNRTLKKKPQLLGEMRQGS